MADQFLGMRGKLVEASGTNREGSKCPWVDQLQGSYRHGALAATGSGSGDDADADALRDERTDSVKTAETYAKGEIPPGTCRMADNMILKRIAVGQADELLPEDFIEGQRAALREILPGTRKDCDELILAKWAALEFTEIDRVGDDPQVRGTLGNSFNDHITRTLFEIDIDIGMRRQELTQRFRQELDQSSRIRHQADVA